MLSNIKSNKKTKNAFEESKDMENDKLVQTEINIKK